MNRHVFKMEFRRAYKGLLIWIAALSAWVAVVILLYPFVEPMYSSIPSEALSFFEGFGGIPKNVIEYYSIQAAMLMQLGGAVFASLVGFSALKSEEREATADTVYTLPVSKETFYITKLMVVFFQILIFSFAVMTTSFICLVIADGGVNFNSFFVFHIYNTGLYIILGGIGFSMAAFIRKSSKSAYALLVPVPLFIIDFVSRLTNNKIISNLKYISAFSFASSTDIIANNITEPLLFFVYAVIVLCSLLTGYFIFKRKEFLI